ncbi:histidine phosphatase family protein [Leptolyngbya sp. FACHB-261]|uniref:histidine phosphatase family protein n=1 Tax=Leptolyngbya sp. FACHB-261 TaxID=2692806 RepID=UPI0016854B18|nr:histidine phosphatase family protein [Leptolyngbya sp. FACHB-261]MBD2104893.1 histidine phosphatase family protein [Leptolyngbya sp. FACHB-261]
MSLTLYFLRHGQTACSRENAFCGSIDPELTSEGIEMAQAFAEAYRTTAWTAVFASPMKRTIATVNPICEALGLEIQLRDGLREIHYGQWEGLSVDKVKETYREDHIRWTADPAWYPPTGGEAAVAIATRALKVVEEIKQRYSSGNVLVASHKATIRILLCSLLGVDVGRFRYRIGCPVGSISIVEFGDHGPLVRALAERSHLSERLRSLPGT